MVNEMIRLIFSSFLASSLFLLTHSAFSHEINNSAYKAATSEDIKKWSKSYSCKMDSLKMLSIEGSINESFKEDDSPFVLSIDHESLTLDWELFSTSEIYVSPMDLYISKAYGGEIIAHGNISNAILTSNGFLTFVQHQRGVENGVWLMTANCE